MHKNLKKGTWHGFPKEVLKIIIMCKLPLQEVRRRWRRKRVKTMKDQAEDFNIFGPHIIRIIQLCRRCICHGILHQVWLVTLNGLILIYGCNIISYVMKGYYQVTIHLISYKFVADPKGRNTWFVILFVYFSYMCFEWSLHGNGRYLSIVLRVCQCMADIVF